MSALSYFNEPAPLAWDVAAAIFGSTGEGGLYNPSSLDTLFQDANGTTPAVPGSPVGLVLDKSLGATFGPELSPNAGGAFVNIDNIGFITSTGDLSGGSIVVTPTGASAHARWMISGLVFGDTYEATVRARRVSGTGQRIQAWTWATVQTTPLTDTMADYKFILPATSTSGYIRVYADAVGSTSVVEIEKVSIRHISGNYLSQPTTAARPILARMPKTGRRNLVANSEDLNSWAKSTVSTINVDTSAGPIFDASGHRLDRVSTLDTSPVRRVQESGIVVTPSVPHRVSAFVSKDTSNAPAIAVFESPVTSNELGRVTVDFSGAAPTAVASVGATDATIHEVRPGVYRVAATIPANPATSAAVLLYPNRNSGGGSTFFGGAQLTRGTEDYPYQRVTNAYDVTEAGVPDTYSLVYDLADDALTTTLPQAINGDILIAGSKGSIIEPVSYEAGSTFTLGPDTYTGGTPGILRAIGDIVGVVLIDRTLTQTERDVLIEHYKGKGAKGLLVPGPELVVNGDFSDGDNGWGYSSQWEVIPGEARRTGTSTGGVIGQTTWQVQAGRIYLTKWRRLDEIVKSDTIRVNVKTGPVPPQSGGDNIVTPYINSIGTVERLFQPASDGWFSLYCYNSSPDIRVTDVSVRELRPQEDW